MYSELFAWSEAHLRSGRARYYTRNSALAHMRPIQDGIGMQQEPEDTDTRRQQLFHHGS